MKDIWDLAKGNESEIRKSLVNNGYFVNKLSQRGEIILFYGLGDILFVVNGRNFDIVTLSKAKIDELFSLNLILPHRNETRMEKTIQVYEGMNSINTNKYLSEGRFHFVKLTPYDTDRGSLFLCNISGMRPYPRYSGNEKIYNLSYISNIYNTIKDKLKNYQVRLTLENGSSVTLMKGSKLKGTVMSGYIIGTNVSNEAENIFIFDIINIEYLDENPFLASLQVGVVKYNKRNITLNRELLEDYYGSRLYTKLESLNTRYKYCLDDCYHCSDSDLDLLINKYGLDLKVSTISELKDKLSKLIKNKKESNDIIRARVLTKNLKHQSFYMTVDLTKVKPDDWRVMDYKMLEEHDFTVAAVSKGTGYVTCTVSANSKELAIKYADNKLEYLYGDIEKVIGVDTVYKITLDEQYDLRRLVRLDLKNNFNDYSSILRMICVNNQLPVPTDNEIKYLFANKIARSNKTVYDITNILLNFLEMISDPKTSSKMIKLELINISSDLVKKDLAKFRKNPNDFTPITSYARYKLLKNGNVSTTVELYHNDEYLCTKSFKEKTK